MPIKNNITLTSPGVQINEVDLTQRAATKIGTNVFVCGFAPQGPADEIIEIGTRAEFTQIYGQPTNAAERYFYHTVSQLFNSPVNVYVNRLPYGEQAGDGFSDSFYSALVYPVMAVKNGTFVYTLASDTDPVSGYYLGAPYLVNLTLSAYNALLDNNFTWSSTSDNLSGLNNWTAGYQDLNVLGKAGLIILNKAQVANNGRFEGYYATLVDNTNNNPATPFDSIQSIRGVTYQTTNYVWDLNSTTQAVTIPEQRLNFQVSLPAGDIPTGVSISEVVENVTEYSLNSRSFDDTLTLAVFKLRQSTFAPDTIKLDYVFEEAYVGSLDYHRQINSNNGGAAISYFLPTVAGASPNVKVLVNPYISGQPIANANPSNYRTTTWLDLSGVPTTKVRVATTSLTNLGTTLGLSNSQYVSIVGTTSATVGTITTEVGSTVNSLWELGVFTPTQLTNKSVGNIPLKLQRVFDRLENTEVYDVDIIADGGISTIYTTTQLLSSEYFDDTVNMSQYVSPLRSAKPTADVLVNSNANALVTNWNTIYSAFNAFCQYKRKDCLFIADPYRNIFVEGASVKTVSIGGYNFSQYLYSPLRHLLYNANSSYSCIYGTWALVNDTYTNTNVWIPFSGVAAQIMGNTDANFKPWFAPAGFTRGIVNTINDIAYYPNQTQRDQLYPISINPVAFFPNEGFVVNGQKTLLKRPSAFDRINVRRLFLYLEKATKNTVKYFVFEPNTLFTRTNLVNTINPIFDDAKNTEGMYDYLIVCDERNNTPEVIDQNQLIVDIYIKPTRAAEFILVNFIATRTSQNFQELVG